MTFKFQPTIWIAFLYFQSGVGLSISMVENWNYRANPKYIRIYTAVFNSRELRMCTKYGILTNICHNPIVGILTKFFKKMVTMIIYSHSVILH